MKTHVANANQPTPPQKEEANCSSRVQTKQEIMIGRWVNKTNSEEESPPIPLDMSQDGKCDENVKVSVMESTNQAVSSRPQQEVDARPRYSSKSKQDSNKMEEPNDENISCGSQDKMESICCKPQEETYRPRAFKTEEGQNDLCIADPTSTSQGSEGNSDHLALDDNGVVGGQQDKSAKASSRDAIFVTGQELGSDKNYGYEMGISSSQMLGNQNNTLIDGNMDTSTSLDTKEDQNDLFNAYPTSISQGSQDIPSNFALDNNDAVDGRPDKTANTSRGGKELDSDNNYRHKNGACSNQMRENQNNTLIDGNMDTSSSRDNEEVQNDLYNASPTSTSQGSEDIPGNFALDNNDTVDGRLDKTANASRGGKELDSDNNYGHKKGSFSNQMLGNQNSTFIDGNVDTSSPYETGPGNVFPLGSLPHANYTLEGGKPDCDNHHGQMIKNNTSVDDNDSLSDKRPNNSTICPHVNVTEESELYKDTLVDKKSVVMALKDEAEKNPSMSITYKADKTKSIENSHVSMNQGNHPESSKIEEQNVQGSRNKSCTVHCRLHEDASERPFVESPEFSVLISSLTRKFLDEKGPISSKNKQKQVKMDEYKKEIGPKVFKTRQEQNLLNVGGDITKKKDISSKHESDGGLAYSGDTLVGGQDSNTSEGSRDISGLEDTEPAKRNHSGHKLIICSNQNLINPNTVSDKMVAGCSVRFLSSSSFNNLSNACAIEDKELHEDTSEVQKPFAMTLGNNAAQNASMSCTCAGDKTKSVKISHHSPHKDNNPKYSKIKEKHVEGSKNIILTVESRLHEDASERQKLFVEGSKSHVEDKAFISDAYETDKTKNISCKSLDEKGRCSSKNKLEHVALDEPKNELEIKISKTVQEQTLLYIGCEITKKKAIASPNHESNGGLTHFGGTVVGVQDSSASEGSRGITGPEDPELDKRNHSGPKMSIQSNQNQVSKTGQEQYVLNVGRDITKKKCIASPSHDSDGDLTHSGDTVVGGLDSSASEGSRGVIGPENKEMVKRNHSGHEISMQNLIRPKMDTRYKEIFSLNNRSNAIEGNEDTLEGQKCLTGSKSLGEEKDFIDPEVPHDISSDNVPQGNEVDLKAFETREPCKYASNQSESDCNPTNHTTKSVFEASESNKTPKKSNNRGRNSKSNMPNGKTARMPEPKRGEKAYRKHHSENRTLKTHTPDDEADDYKAPEGKTSQSEESCRPVTSGRQCGGLADWVTWFFKLLLLLFFPSVVQAFPDLWWQQWWFCAEPNHHLINQTLTIKNENRAAEQYSFEALKVPDYHNCTKIKALVFLINHTCLEMFTTDNQTQNWLGEYGADYTGFHMTSVRGGLVNYAHVKDKIDQYTPNNLNQSTIITEQNATISQNETTGLDTWKIILCTLLPILFMAGLVVYFVHKRCTTNRPPATDIKRKATGGDAPEVETKLINNGTENNNHHSLCTTNRLPGTDIEQTAAGGDGFEIETELPNGIEHKTQSSVRTTNRPPATDIKRKATGGDGLEVETELLNNGTEHNNHHSL